MALHVVPLPKTSEATANVRVTNSNASIDWLILLIERVGEYEYPGIALKPNSDRDLTLPPGTYHFFFSFQNLNAQASVDVQIATGHAKSPFPANPKSVGAAPGQLGQTGITVLV